MLAQRNFMLLGLLALAAPAYAVPVLPGEGFQVSQVNFTFSGASEPDSDYGLAAVNIPQLTASTGISQGFLNVVSSSGQWVVRNMVVDSHSGLPGISTMFSLGISPGTQVSSLGLQTELTTHPLASFAGNGSNGTYVVNSVAYNAQGAGAPVTTAPTYIIDPALAVFGAIGGTAITWQPGHTSVEQDDNQCAPAAVANSLDWLRNVKGATLTKNLQNVPGIAGNPANSLVGALDNAMKRQAGQGVANISDILNGKLKFIDNPKNGLKYTLTIQHWPDANFGPAGNQTVGATESIDASKIPGGPKKEIDWILSELAMGEDVELRWQWPGDGGHMVDLIGGGRVLGVPWIAFVHDANQGNAGGTNWFDGGVGFSYLDGNNAFVSWVGSTKPATLSFAVSESVPEPITLTIFAIGVLGTTALRRRRTPKDDRSQST